MRSLIAVCSALLVFASASSSAAALYTFSASDRPGTSPDANATPGGAVDVWSVSVSAPGNGSVNGDFHGNSANNGGSGGSGAGAGSDAWAMYANSGQTATSSAAVTPLTGLSVSHIGDYISLDFDNGFIDGGSSVGVRFLDSNSNVRLTFQFVGGNTDYQILDASGTVDPGKVFTADGFNIKLALTSNSGGYTLTTTGSSPSSTSGTLLQNTSSLDMIQVFNTNAGGGDARNLYFNNLAISAVPEASPALMIPLASIAAALVAVVVRRRPLGHSTQT
jgi:hypothetical protein